MQPFRALRAFFGSSRSLEEGSPSPLNRSESSVVPPTNRERSRFVPPNPYNDALVNQKLKELGIELIDINEKLLEDFSKKTSGRLIKLDFNLNIKLQLITFFLEKINQQTALEEQDQTTDLGINYSSTVIDYSQLRRLEQQDQTTDSGIDPFAPGIPYSELRRL